MSYKRRAKKVIPKNTDYCLNCKHLLKNSVYEYEEDTNGYYKTDEKEYFCKYLNIKSISSDEAHEMLFNCNLYDASDIGTKTFIDNVFKSEDFHLGRKVCGLYLYKEKSNGHFVKLDNVVKDVENIKFDELNDDDVPF